MRIFAAISSIVFGFRIDMAIPSGYTERVRETHNGRHNMYEIKTLLKNKMMAKNYSKREAMELIVRHTRHLLIDLNIYSDALCSELAWGLYSEIATA